jgi:hypothetical protein
MSGYVPSLALCERALRFEYALYLQVNYDSVASS